MKIGLFGGAFNPIHNGHINLANGFANTLNLDKVIFIPTANPPHKSSVSFASGEDRIAMTSLAVKGYNNFEVSDIEFKLSDKSYTYLTVNEMKKIYRGDELFLIIGADQFFNFQKWYRYDDILSGVHLCISARENEQEKAKMLAFARDELKLNDDDFTLLNLPVLKISSSQIREKVKTHSNISHLVCTDVINYIVDRGLYCV